MPESRRPTMMDVAAAAGVSQTTVSLVLNGIAEAEAGAAVARGARLTADASGRVVAAASGNIVIGVAMAAAGAAGEIIPINVVPSTF